MRTKKYRYFENDTTYDLSISDLMSALCCIFVVVIISFVVSLQDKNGMADKYAKLQHELYLDLRKELSGSDMKKLNVTVDPDTLSVRFHGNTCFADNNADLNDNFKIALQKFFPKLVKIIEQDKYKGEIEEIRIEGFTAPSKYAVDGPGSQRDYTEGMLLSQKRAMNVLLYCLDYTNYTQEKDPVKKRKEQEWLRKHIVSNGYSLAKPLNKYGQPAANDKEIDKSMTRRVEFRVKTNSDNIIKKFQNNFGQENEVHRYSK